MFLKINKFVYYQLKEIAECHHRKWYRLKQFVEIFIALFYLIRMIITITSYFTNEPFIQYYKIEPLFRYFIHSNPKLFRHYSLSTLMLTIFGLMGRIAFFYSRIDTTVLSYQTIVINIEQYNQCCFTKLQMEKILCEKYEKNIKNLKLIRKFLPDCIFRSICWLLTRLWASTNKIDIQLDMNKWRNVKPLRIQQSITLEDRLKIIRILYKADIIVFYIHILFCKLLYI